MSQYLHHVSASIVHVFHPAAGREGTEKKKRKSAPATAFNLRATPDSLNIRDQYKKQDGFRRNPAP